MSAILAGFASEAELRRALDRLAAEDIGHVEAYTPKALDEHHRGSPLPLLMFLAGMLGFAGFFLLMAYADLWAYPLNIGGRPKFAWPSFVPIAFELAVLCAMGVGFLGYFVVNRMPRLHEPVDESDLIRQATRDGWVVAVRSEDGARLAQAREILGALRPAAMGEIPP